ADGDPPAVSHGRSSPRVSTAFLQTFASAEPREVSKALEWTLLLDRPRPVTIVDIAREAGGSASTGSRVLSGHRPVAARTAAAGGNALERLDYRPNLNAQHLVRGRSMAIGVLTQHPASSFFGELLMGVELGLRDTAYHSIYASGHWEPERELEALNL